MISAASSKHFRYKQIAVVEALFLPLPLGQVVVA